MKHKWSRSRIGILHQAATALLQAIEAVPNQSPTEGDSQ